MTLRPVHYPNEITKGLGAAESVDIAVAFATMSGATHQNQLALLESILDAGGAVRIIVELSQGLTDPKLLQHVLNWKNSGKPVEIRQLKISGGIFHAKVFLFQLSDAPNVTRAIVGSGNWTGPAQSKNVEYGLVLEATNIDQSIKSIRLFFDSMWNSDACTPITPIVLNKYEEFTKKQKRPSRDQATFDAWEDALEELDQSSSSIDADSEDFAFLLGLVTARGHFDRDSQNIKLELRHGNTDYRKGSVSFDVDEAVEARIEQIARRVSQILPDAVISTTISGTISRVEIDLGEISEAADLIFGEFDDTHDIPSEFWIPERILDDSENLGLAFLRGFGASSGLISEGTTIFSSHCIYLRPSTTNIVQIQQLFELLQNVDVATTSNYQPGRSRDTDVKVHCQDWLQIGFGISWMDELTIEGAALNGFPS